LTGLARSIPILKKIQNGIVLVKKKSTGCNQVFDRVLPGQPVGSAGSHQVNPYLKKIQNDIVLVKKRSTGCNLVFDRVLPGQPTGSTGSHRVMTFLIFSSTRLGSSPGSTRRAGPGFKTMVYIFYIHKKKVMFFQCGIKNLFGLNTLT
jgi:hypothetical protein